MKIQMRHKPDTSTTDTDLYHWLPVLNKIHNILESKGENLALVKAALDFLGETVYHSRNKTCCFFVKVSVKDNAFDLRLFCLTMSAFMCVSSRLASISSQVTSK